MPKHNFRSRLMEFLRDADWHLALAYDTARDWLWADWSRRVAGFYLGRDYALAYAKKTGQKIGKNRYRLMFLSVVLAVFVLGSMSTTERQIESPQQPISHIYSKIAFDLGRLAQQLSPIGVASANLPDFGEQDRISDPDNSERLSGEANNFGEQSLSLGPRTETVRLAKGETLARALSKAGAGTEDVAAITLALKKVFDPRRLNHGKEIEITLSPVPDAGPDEREMVVDTINFIPEPSKRIVVTRQENGQYRAKAEARQLTTKNTMLGVTISGSLSASARRAGIPANILSEVTRVLSYDVDFQRDVHPGDRLQVLFEKIVDEDGVFVRNGALLYVGLRYGQKDLNIYRYAAKGERPDYYHQNGKSIRRALLRTPIDGARLTSGFGMRRHPVLGYSKMHEGVDFAGPMGTPIIAAGDGTVMQKGWNGGYGHYVRIQHNREFSTAYAHLSRYHKNLRVGQKIRQGEVIGYLGSTGLSTGPHLHYEVIKSGRKVNPVGVKFATGTQLAGKDLQNFRQQMASIDASVKTAQTHSKQQLARR